MDPSRETIASQRFGYGRHPGQAAPDGPEALVAQMSAGVAAGMIFPPPGAAERQAAHAHLRALRLARDEAGGRERLVEGLRAVRAQAGDEAARLLLQRALSPHGFFERLAAFWADHFTVGRRGGNPLTLVSDFEPAAIRPNLGGDFADLLIAATRHPAMLVYLDQNASVGPNSEHGRRSGRGLNENLAREVLELHTLGVGAAYTQADVRAAARVLTGWGIDGETGAFRFRPRRAEPGRHVVLGRAHGGAAPSVAHAEALLRDLARHPATARHIAGRLARHFVADEPPGDLVAALEAAWSASGGHLPTVHAALVRHPAAWLDFGAKVRRPQEVMVATLRAGGIGRAEAAALDARARRRLVLALRDLGQPFFQPPSPAGWPEARGDWLTPQGLAARLRFAGRAGEVLAQRRTLDPRRFAEDVLGEALREDTAFAVGAAAERWEGIAYTLAAPEFHRR